MTIQIIIIAVCILLSAYFSATETAFSSLNKTKIKTLAEKGVKRAVLTNKLCDNYDKLISTILVGNNIVNIAAASLGTLLFATLCNNPDTGATVSTVVITLVVLIFGEITPKSIAKDCPEKFAMFSAPFINVLIIILTPVNFVFSYWKKLVAKMLRLESDNKMSQEELLMLVEEVEQEGSIDKNESILLRNAIEFAEQEAEDILTHRVDLEAVPADAEKEEIADLFAQTKLSRILVYDDNIDNIIGVIHHKDFYTSTGITDRPIKDIISPIIYVLKTEKISSLLKHLQKAKTHIAVVLDEYGGTYGIVTMEDILEELVGEIWDEHDEVVEEYSQVNSDTFSVDCSVELDDFCERFDQKIDSEMVSLGGWVSEKLGKVPEKGDKFSYGNMEITVTGVENHRAETVDVYLKPEPQDGEKGKEKDRDKEKDREKDREKEKEKKGKND